MGLDFDLRVCVGVGVCPALVLLEELPPLGVEVGVEVECVLGVEVGVELELDEVSVESAVKIGRVLGVDLGVKTCDDEGTFEELTD